jgi:opacity protein-like surface antigen
MKTRIATLIAVGLVSMGVSAIAQSTEVGPYVRAAMGASFVDNISVKDFYGPVGDSSINLDTGIRFDIDVGYAFNKFLAAEFEFGWTYNSIGSISGPITVSDASYGNFPFLVNLIFQLPLAKGRFIPYIGGGGGGTIGIFDAAYISDPFVAISGSDSDVSYAWQAFGGIRFAINDQMSVGIVYKYLGSGSTSYYEGVIFPSGSQGQLSLGSTVTQSIEATFNYRF